MKTKNPCPHKHCSNNRASLKRMLRRKNILFGVACFSAGMFLVNVRGAVRTAIEVAESLITEYPCGAGMGLAFVAMTLLLVGCCAWIIGFVIRSHVDGMPGVIDMAYETGLAHARAVHEGDEIDDRYRESHDEEID